MLIVALVLAVIGLAALVTAVVTSNELIAWVCIAASVIGVVLLIVDALRERSRGDAEAPTQAADEEFDAEYPEEPAADTRTETTESPAEPVDSDVAEVVEEDRPR
jgi:broad specificity phosphatase PhoE